MRPLSFLRLAAAALFACGLARAGSFDEPFRYRVSIKLPASSQEELAGMVLPPSVYAATRAHLADVRIAGGDSGEPVPCLVERVAETREERVREPLGLRLVRAEELADRHLRVTLERAEEAGETRPLCGLSIRTPLKDYLRHVSVEVSADGRAWTTVVADACIADLSSYADFAQSEVEVPARQERHLRVTIEQMSDPRVGGEATVSTVTDAKGDTTSVMRTLVEESRPFRVDGVVAWTTVAKQVPHAVPMAARTIRTLAEVPNELSARYPTARLLCFTAERMPLERVELRSGKGLLRLSYVLLEHVDAPAQAGGEEWREAAAGTVARLVFRELKQERMSVRFPESRASMYCLVFADRAGARDLSIAGGGGADYRVVFPYSPGQSRALLVGDPDTRGSLGYQPEAIRALLQKKVATVTAEAVGGLCENPEWRGVKGRQWLAERRWLLPAAVTVAAVALGIALMAAFMRMPEPED